MKAEYLKRHERISMNTVYTEDMRGHDYHQGTSRDVNEYRRRERRSNGIKGHKSAPKSIKGHQRTSEDIDDYYEYKGHHRT